MKVRDPSKETIWVEKYRPSTVAECLLPSRLSLVFAGIVAGGTMQNLLLSGKPGTGKTSVALAMANEMGAEVKFINASEDSGIDVLRGEIRQFASAVSLTGRPKVVILDEADYLNPQSTQPALRSAIEEFSRTCNFVLTCNYKNKIIPPLHSRFVCVDFTMTKEETREVATAFLARLEHIVKCEGVAYDLRGLAKIVKVMAPDWRGIINAVQGQSASGATIDEGIVARRSGAVVDVIGFMAKKDFASVRKWAAEHADAELSAILRDIYDVADVHFKGKSIPVLILILGDYMRNEGFVADKEIHLAACLTQIMSECEFKDG